MANRLRRYRGFMTGEYATAQTHRVADDNAALAFDDEDHDGARDSDLLLQPEFEGMWGGPKTKRGSMAPAVGAAPLFEELAVTKSTIPSKPLSKLEQTRMAED